MRSSVIALSALLLLAACSSTATGSHPAGGTVFPFSATPTPEPSPWVIGQRYAFSIYVHCGISKHSPVEFDGGWWVPDPPLASGGTPPSPMGYELSDSGTMELVDPDHAIYRSAKGPVLNFIRMSTAPSIMPCM